MASYVHQQLPDAEKYLRILTLEGGKFDDALEATLSVERFDSKPSYEALSYVWGAPEKPHQVQLRQNESYAAIDITENLNLALRRLRHNSDPRRLWTDAVCINQTDNTEKSHQVSKMTEIYSSAEKVLIYLGEKTENTSEAIALLDKIYKAMIDPQPTSLRNGLQWIQYNGLPSVREPHKWVPLKDFFCHDWFHRKWTIQEAAVASKATMICGDWQEDWGVLDVFQKAIDAHGLAVIDHTTYSDQVNSKKLQQGLAQLRWLNVVRSFWQKNARFSLMDLAYRFQTARATDPRDHLFALVGISIEGLNFEGHALALLPDYKSSTKETLPEEYAWHFLKAKRNLEVLYRAGIQGHELLLPSWIPNWYGGHDSFASEFAEGPWDPLRRQNLQFYNVAPGTSVELRRPDEPRVLDIKGVCIDSVRKLALKHLQQDPNVPMSKDFLLKQTTLHIEESDGITRTIVSYPTGEDPKEAQWRTFICNVTMDLTKSPKEYEKRYEAWRRCNRVDKGAETTEALIADFRLQQPFDNVFSLHNKVKVFGATTNNYFGMFPKSANAGDEIWVLFGGEFPFVLRRKERIGYYELVGQCYIHGVMEGQLELKQESGQMISLA